MKRLVKVNIGGRGMMSPQEQSWGRGMAESQRGNRVCDQRSRKMNHGRRSLDE